MVNWSKLVLVVLICGTRQVLGWASFAHVAKTTSYGVSGAKPSVYLWGSDQYLPGYGVMNFSVRIKGSWLFLSGLRGHDFFCPVLRRGLDFFRLVLRHGVITFWLLLRLESCHILGRSFLRTGFIPNFDGVMTFLNQILTGSWLFLVGIVMGWWNFLGREMNPPDPVPWKILVTPLFDLIKARANLLLKSVSWCGCGPNIRTCVRPMMM